MSRKENMRTLTIYQALTKCWSHKRYALEQRNGDSFGIAVNQDYYARQWQRYDRLWRKLDRRLVAILTHYDSSQM